MSTFSPNNSTTIINVADDGPPTINFAIPRDKALLVFNDADGNEVLRIEEGDVGKLSVAGDYNVGARLFFDNIIAINSHTINDLRRDLSGLLSQVIRVQNAFEGGGSQLECCLALETLFNSGGSVKRWNHEHT